MAKTELLVTKIILILRCCEHRKQYEDVKPNKLLFVSLFQPTVRTGLHGLSEQQTVSLELLSRCPLSGITGHWY